LVLFSEPLIGLYKVTVTLGLGLSRFDEIVRSFILTTHDEQHNPVGEFLTPEDMAGNQGASCELNQATNYMVIPCGGTSKYEPT